MNRKSIPSLFLSTAEKNSHRTTFHFFATSWENLTYAQFLSQVNGMISLLLQSGLRKGDRVAIVSENRPEWCASYLAVVMCGGIAVPIDMQLNYTEIRNLLTDSETKIVFCSPKTRDTVLRAIEGSNVRPLNLSMAGTTCHGAVSNAQPVPEQVSEEDSASIIYTSGTTGIPKGVVLTHKNLCSDAEVLIGAHLVTADDNVLALLPLHHTYPFMCTFLTPLALGATITFPPGLKAPEITSAIRDRGVTIVVCVPRLLEAIWSGIIARIKAKRAVSPLLLGMVRLCGIVRRRTGVNVGKTIFRSIHKNFGPLKFFASGGARLDPALMENLEALGFTVLEGYGLTETSPVITFNPPRKRKPGSAGMALPGVEIRISDDGEIMVKGPMVMKGYYENPEATTKAFKDGWLLTGDVGTMDRDGYLFITGRKKEVIVLSSGKNVYPEDVEKAYQYLPLVQEIAVIAEERGGTVVGIHGIIVPDLHYAKESLIANISDTLKWQINEVSMRLPEYMRIRGFTLSSGPLPRTPLGKLRRFMIQDMMKVSRTKEFERAEDRTLTGDETGRRVADCIRSLMTEAIPVQSSDNLELDLGFDSLMKIELISSLESVFSTSLPESLIAEVQTVGDIVAKLKALTLATESGEGRPITWKAILEKEPSREDVRKTVSGQRSVGTAIIRFLFALQKLLFGLLFRLQVKGLQNVPREGPFVIAPNHASYLDGFVIGSSISFRTFQKLYFLGIQTVFAGKLRSWLARVIHVIPIDAETYLNKAMQISAYLLKRGGAVCIFPEGGRSFDGELLPFKKGIGALALELGVPVVPALIKGSFRALPRGARIIRPVKIEVVFGTPLHPSDLDAGTKPVDADRYQFFADTLRERIKGLWGQ